MSASGAAVRTPSSCPLPSFVIKLVDQNAGTLVPMEPTDHGHCRLCWLRIPGEDRQIHEEPAPAPSDENV
jgi:hypothetical protein